MASTCVYIYCLFLLAQKNTTKTRPGLKISFQKKLPECFSNFLGLTNFLRLEETIDWSKLLKFGRTCSNWQGKIGKNTKIGESTISEELKLKQNNVDLRENSNIPKLQNIILRQTWHTENRLIQSHQQRSQRDMGGHDSRILDDESKQIFIQFELSRAKRI